MVTRFGVLPAEVLANSRLLPSRGVMGIVPPDARAVEVIRKLEKSESQLNNEINH